MGLGVVEDVAEDEAKGSASQATEPILLPQVAEATTGVEADERKEDAFRGGISIKPDKQGLWLHDRLGLDSSLQ